MFSCHVKKKLRARKKRHYFRCAAKENDTAKDDVDDADVDIRKCWLNTF